MCYYAQTYLNSYLNLSDVTAKCLTSAIRRISFHILVFLHFLFNLLNTFPFLWISAELKMNQKSCHHKCRSVVFTIRLCYEQSCPQTGKLNPAWLSERKLKYTDLKLSCSNMLQDCLGENIIKEIQKWFELFFMCLQFTTW